MARQIFCLAVPLLLFLLPQLYPQSCSKVGILNKSAVCQLQLSVEIDETERGIYQVWSFELKNTLVAPNATLLQENIDDTQLQQQINDSFNTVVQNMAAYDSYMTGMIDQIFQEHYTNLQNKIAQFKTILRTTRKTRSITSVNVTNPVVKCVFEESKLDVLASEINAQIKKCATVAMAEMVNVISDSLNEAQTFMTIPQVIGRDIQRCGLSYSCRWDIVGDAVSEALQVPPKVFALAAKIQSIALRTVVSVDNCGLQGLRQIAETGVGILEDIFACIADEINSGDDSPKSR